MRSSLASVLPLLLLAACGARSEAADKTSEDDASCFVLASSYDQTCAHDDDCVLVVPGGNVCDPCSAGTGCLTCTNLAAVNASAASAYTAALHAALAPYESSAQAQQSACLLSGCPDGITPVCQMGVCTTSAGSMCTP